MAKPRMGGRPLEHVVAPLWWPEHMRHLAWALNEAIDKAHAARAALTLARTRDRAARLAMMGYYYRPAETPRASAETLLLQQVLRAYEEEATALRMRLAREFHTMTAMLDLDGKKDPGK